MNEGYSSEISSISFETGITNYQYELGCTSATLGAGISTLSLNEFASNGPTGFEPYKQVTEQELSERPAFETQYNGFTDEQKAVFNNMFNILGIGTAGVFRSVNLVEKADYDEDRHNGVLGTWNRRTHDYSVRTDTFRDVQEHQGEYEVGRKFFGTLIHEAAHGFTPGLNENITPSEKESAIEYSVEEATKVLLESGKHLNGYHEYLTSNYKASVNTLEQKYRNGEISWMEKQAIEVVEFKLLKDEVRAITAELRATNPDHLIQLEQTVLRKSGSDLNLIGLGENILMTMMNDVKDVHDLDARLEAAKEYCIEIGAQRLIAPKERSKVLITMITSTIAQEALIVGVYDDLRHLTLEEILRRKKKPFLSPEYYS